MTEGLQVVLEPAMDENGKVQWALISMGVNIKFPKRFPEPAGWITKQIPADKVLYVTDEDETDQPNTWTRRDIVNEFRKLVKLVEEGLTEEGDW